MELLEDKVYKDWVKSYLYSKQNKRCIGCLDEYSKRNTEIDHIEPKSKGGSDEPSNLQLLCSTCNRIKGTSSQSVFLAKTAHLRIGKSTEGMDFDSYNLETYSEHDWSFREVAEEILREVGMPKKEIRKTLKRCYPHGFLPNVDLEPVENAAREYDYEVNQKEEREREEEIRDEIIRICVEREDDIFEGYIIEEDVEQEVREKYNEQDNRK